MGLVKKALLVCDRCGASIEVPEHSAPFDVADGRDGWVRVSQDRFLCPECSPGYRLLQARHEVERDDCITNKT